MQLSTEELELMFDVCRQWLSIREIVTSQDEKVRELMTLCRSELEARYELESFNSDCGDACKL